MTEKEKGPLHYRSQAGQPYGSESRKCDNCGVMIWPAQQREKTPRHTDDLSVYNADPTNCYALRSK